MTGGSPSGQTIVITDGAVQRIVAGSTLGQSGFIVQNLTVGTAPAGRVIIGGAGVDDGTGIVLMPRSSTAAQPTDFSEEGSNGDWYARARGADVTLMVMIKR